MVIMVTEVDLKNRDCVVTKQKKNFDKKVTQKYVTKRVIQHHMNGINTTKGYII